MVSETKIGRKTIHGVHHPRDRSCVRLFITSGHKVIDVTAYVAKVTKLKLVQRRKWIDVGNGSNPVQAVVSIFAAAVGRDKQPYTDLY